MQIILLEKIANVGNLGDVVACPAKGTLPGIGVPCLDYVQSKRDGSGDTHVRRAPSGR